MKRHNSSQKNLSTAYLKLLQGGPLYPSLNGYSAFIQGSGYNVERITKKWYHGLARKNFLLLMKKGFSQVWLPENEFKKSGAIAFNEYLNAPATFHKRLVCAEKNIQYIDKLYHTFTYEKIRTVDTHTLLQLLVKIRDTIWDSNAALFFSVLMDKEYCLDLLQKQKISITNDAIAKIWHIATTPVFPSFDVMQKRYFLSLLSAKKNWKEIVDSCQFFLTDYYSAKSIPDVATYVRKHFRKILERPANAPKELKQNKRIFETKQKQFDRWLKRLPKNNKKIASYLQLVMVLRDKRKNHFAKGLTIMYRIAEKIFSDEGISRELIPYYTVDELHRGTAYLRASLTNLKNRQKGFQLLIPYKGRIQKKQGSIAGAVKEMRQYFIAQNASHAFSHSLSGQSTYSGIVRGRVRVILHMSAKEKFEKGEILVAGMTRPEYVPLMKIASAIVTNEGGITCHAAIVSRELKKPCIVGTKIATFVLKTGDLVEVDANRGIVRKLKDK